jgi:Chaperone of endosialidase
MKKITLLLSFCAASFNSYAQSITLKPNNSDEIAIIRKDGIGFSHESANGLVKLGTWVSNSGFTYIQTHTNHPLYFATNNGAAKLVVATNGNIGISTSTPTATLDVARGTAFDGTAIFRGTNNTSHFNYGNLEDTYIRGGKPTSNVILADHPGLVGIGTTTPSTKLHISNDRGGTGTLNQLIYNTGTYYGGIGLYSSYGGVTLFGAANNLQVADNSGGFASVSASAFNVSSDITVKKEIVNLGSANFDEYLAQIRSIQSATYRYNWEDATSRITPHIGFIAQTLPDAVVTSMDKTSGTSSEKILGYNLSDMAGLTLMGLKAIDAKMQLLEETIKVLQAEILKLKK